MFTVNSDPYKAFPGQQCKLSILYLKKQVRSSLNLRPIVFLGFSGPFRASSGPGFCRPQAKGAGRVRSGQVGLAGADGASEGSRSGSEAGDQAGVQDGLHAGAQVDAQVGV